MAVSRLKKQEQVAKLTELSQQAVAVTVAENLGVNSNDMNALRVEARNQDVILFVAKNKLSRLVLGEHKDFNVLDEDLNNPILLGFSLTNLSSSAKLLGNFAKKNDRLVVRSVAIEGVRYGSDSIDYVMNLPTREQAIAMVARGIQSPVVQLAGTLVEIYGQFARVLHAVAEQKQS